MPEDGRLQDDYDADSAEIILHPRSAWTADDKPCPPNAPTACYRALGSVTVKEGVIAQIRQYLTFSLVVERGGYGTAESGFYRYYWGR